MSERLAEYENEVDRWHVDTEKRTEALEAVEGGEVPDRDPNADFTTS